MVTLLLGECSITLNHHIVNHWGHGFCQYWSLCLAILYMRQIQLKYSPQYCSSYRMEVLQHKPDRKLFHYEPVSQFVKWVYVPICNAAADFVNFIFSNFVLNWILYPTRDQNLSYVRVLIVLKAPVCGFPCIYHVYYYNQTKWSFIMCL